jgi:hypothetical protein
MPWESPPVWAAIHQTKNKKKQPGSQAGNDQRPDGGEIFDFGDVMRQEGQYRISSQ